MNVYVCVEKKKKINSWRPAVDPRSENHQLELSGKRNHRMKMCTYCKLAVSGKREQYTKICTYCKSMGASGVGKIGEHVTVERGLLPLNLQDELYFAKRTGKKNRKSPPRNPRFCHVGAPEMGKNSLWEFSRGFKEFLQNKKWIHKDGRTPWRFKLSEFVVSVSVVFTRGFIMFLYLIPYPGGTYQNELFYIYYSILVW